MDEVRDDKIEKEVEYKVMPTGNGDEFFINGQTVTITNSNDLSIDIDNIEVIIEEIDSKIATGDIDYNEGILEGETNIKVELLESLDLMYLTCEENKAVVVTVGDADDIGVRVIFEMFDLEKGISENNQKVVYLESLRDVALLK